MDNQKYINSHLLQYILISLLWMALPVCLLAEVPARYAVCIFLLLSFMVLINGSISYIYRDMIISRHHMLGCLLIILYGQVEVNRLKKMEANRAVTGEPGTGLENHDSHHSA